MVLLTDWLTSNWKYIFILVSIHKSCIVYLEKICCADRSWKFIFWSWKSHGKSLLKKSGTLIIALMLSTGGEAKPSPFLPLLVPEEHCWVEWFYGSDVLPVAQPTASKHEWNSKHFWPVVKVRGNAVPGPYNLLASVPRPHTAVNGTSRLRGAPPIQLTIGPPEFLGPQIYTLTAATNDSNGGFTRGIDTRTHQEMR